MMTHCSDPRDGLELLHMRERLRSWRYYDHLRTDAKAPARQPQIGTYTPVLASNGADLAAAIQTIREIGDGAAFDAAIGDAFDGAEMEVVAKDDGYFDIQLSQIGLLRPLKVAELSDGTLRYLLLVAALLSPDPPSLMVLNEPETSLHPNLLAPLARLVVTTACKTQLIIVTHAPALVDTLANEAEVAMFALSKHLGETVVSGPAKPSWQWPSRT
jgi:predicted ATPase